MPRQPNPKIDREAPAWRVMSYWGSNLSFAKAIGRTHSTTAGWLEKGTIDPDFWPEIIAAAKRDRKPLKAEDFVDRRLFKSTPAAPAIEASAA